MPSSICPCHVADVHGVRKDGAPALECACLLEQDGVVELLVEHAEPLGDARAVGVGRRRVPIELIPAQIVRLRIPRARVDAKVGRECVRSTRMAQRRDMLEVVRPVEPRVDRPERPVVELRARQGGARE